MLELRSLDIWVPQSCLYFFILIFLYDRTISFLLSCFYFFLKQGSTFSAMMKVVVRYGMATTALGGGIRIAI